MLATLDEAKSDSDITLMAEVIIGNSALRHNNIDIYIAPKTKQVCTKALGAKEQQNITYSKDGEQNIELLIIRRNK